jgi:hypothetical protein
MGAICGAEINDYSGYLSSAPVVLDFFVLLKIQYKWDTTFQKYHTESDKTITSEI